MLKYICFISLILFVHSLVWADTIQFKYCDQGEVAKITVSNCAGNYCIIHKGKPVELDGYFTANQDTKIVQIKFTGKYAGSDWDFPGLESNGCNHVPCLLVKGQKYHFNYTLVIPTIVPTIKSNVTGKLIGEKGVLACIFINGEVQN